MTLIAGRGSTEKNKITTITIEPLEKNYTHSKLSRLLSRALGGNRGEESLASTPAPQDPPAASPREPELRPESGKTPFE